jgi:hypothetical protein
VSGKSGEFHRLGKVGFTNEERQRNIQASAKQLDEDVEVFLRQHADLGFGFDQGDLAGFVRSDRITRRGALRILMNLKDQGRVHYLAGRWHVGPLPPES